MTLVRALTDSDVASIDARHVLVLQSDQNVAALPAAHLLESNR